MRRGPGMGRLKSGVLVMGGLVAAGGFAIDCGLLPGGAGKGGMAARAQEANGVAPVAVRIPSEREPLSRPPAPAPGAAVHTLGDHLKVTLFERIDALTDNQNSPRTGSPGFVERTELTGEYVVQQNGYIVLPFLGAVEVEGRNTDQVTGALEAAFRQALRREGSASVVLADREPVYVIGGGKTGTFKYTPGMTVLHAVALAGAGNDDRSDLYAHTEYVRELERLQKAVKRLAQLLANAEVLGAERAGRPAEAPGRLIELAGAKEAKRLIEEAARVRKLLLDSKQPQIVMAQTALAAARREHVGHVQKLELAETHARAKQKRRDMLTELRRQDSGTAYNLLQMQSEVADIEARKQEESILIAQSEARIAQAAQAVAKLELDMRLELENEILSTDAAIVELEATVAGSRRLMADLRAASFRLATAGKSVAYEIVRRGRQGSQRLAAQEMTELLPGDLVRLSIAGDGKEADSWRPEL